MANPQLENGYMKLANEVIDQVIRHGFSKRHLNILLFIWRMSYGFNKKSATITRLSDFSLCGVGKQNVKAELEQLEDCRVIHWDRKNNKFTFNKNHNEWKITPIKGWKEEEFDSIVHQNLQEKFSKQEQSSSQNKNLKDENGSRNKNISEDRKDESSQNKNNKNKKVLKTRTYRFLKQELHKPLTLCRTRLGWVPKDSIKDISNKDIKDNSNSNPFTFFEKNISPLSPHAIDRLTDWTETFEDNVIIFAMELSVESDKRSMNYINAVLSNWTKSGVKNLNDAKRASEEFKSSRGAKNNVVQIPDYSRKEDSNEVSNESTPNGFGHVKLYR